MFFDFVFCYSYDKIDANTVNPILEEYENLMKKNEVKENVINIYDCHFGIKLYFKTNDKESLYNDSRNFITIIGDFSPKLKSGLKINNIKQSLLISLIEKFENNLDYDVVNNIKGNFLIIYLNKLNNNIKIINNRFGISPFYYTFVNNHIVLTSNLKLIHKILPSSIINETALVERELFNYTLGNKTLLKNVYSLRPSEILSYKKGRLDSKIYWTPVELYNSNKLSEEEAIETGERIFKNAVEIRSNDREKLCASLTGGFDGRTILSVLNQNKTLSFIHLELKVA